MEESRWLIGMLFTYVLGVICGIGMSMKLDKYPFEDEEIEEKT